MKERLEDKESCTDADNTNLGNTPQALQNGSDPVLQNGEVQSEPETDTEHNSPPQHIK